MTPAAAAAPSSLRFAAVRGTTSALCRPLATDDYVVQSMPDASPAKWHLAHTSWFFEEFVLRPFMRGYRLFDPGFGYLFNSYYESVGPRHSRPQRGLLTRPTVAEVARYREHVDEWMQLLLAGGALAAEVNERITLGLHHEQQHQELLLTDIKHLFSCNPLLPAYLERPPVAAGMTDTRAAADTRFDGGLAEIGHAGDGFAFDNELPRHRVFVAPFRLASRPVTNREFLEFVRAGGYQHAEHWLAEGWAAVGREHWQRPLYWSESLEQEFTLAGLRELALDAPVCHLSYYEADAFARWAGARLPTEFEWEIAAAGLPVSGNFLDSGNLQPVPKGAHSSRMFGDVWEWTASAYAPYPGFQPFGGGLGEYNGKFMVSQLVLRGGSCATPGSHFRPSYRNFFYPAARWQFSGLRLASS